MSNKIAPQGMVVAAFAAIYLIWGSTYLFIGFAVQTIPPHIMAGIRFLVAGTLLYLFLRARGVPNATRLQWRSAFIVGVLLLAGGNGSVSWAEKTVPTGLAALIIAIVPLWMVLLEWLRPGGVKPRGGVIAGVALGLIGMVLLIGPASLGLDQPLDSFGVSILIFASLSWSFGSIYSRHAPQPESPLMMTALEMLLGGAVLWLMGIPLGEWQELNLSAISPLSWGALVYLTLIGSLVAFTAYVYLLQVSTPARVSTYAYVNPVVAVFLGWALNGESLTPLTLLASFVIVVAVAIITFYQTRPAPRVEPEPCPARVVRELAQHTKATAGE